MPQFDFDKEIIKNPKSFKIHCTIFAILSFFYWFFGFTGRVQYGYGLLTLTLFTTMILWELIGFLLQIHMIVSTAFCNLYKWEKFLKNSLYIEKSLNVKRKVSLKDSLLFIFLLLNAILVGLLIANVIEFSNRSFSWSTETQFIMLYMFHYIIFLMFMMVNGIIRNMGFSIEEWMDIFQNTCKKQLENKTNDFPNQIRKLANIFRKSLENIYLFNQIFGWQLLGSTMIASFVILTVLNFVSIYALQIKIEKLELSPSLIFFNSAFHGFVCVSYSFDIFLINNKKLFYQFGQTGFFINIYSIGKQIATLQENCYKYKNLLDQKDRKEIIYLINEIENSCPQFSAAGFFCINGRKTILKVFASIATYFLAFIEFNKTYVGKN